jgi:hypothetical protein
MITKPASRLWTPLLSYSRQGTHQHDKVLRFRSPFPRLAGVTTTDTEIGGHAVPAGQLVILWIAAADRDAFRSLVLISVKWLPVVVAWRVVACRPFVVIDLATTVGSCHPGEDPVRIGAVASNLG